MGEIKITWQAVSAGFTMLCLTIIVGLALNGNQAATTVLIAGAAVLLVIIGAGIVIVVNGQAAAQESRRFQKNMAQDLALMQQMQRLQNLQSRGLLQQAQQSQLSAGPGGSALMFADDVFAGLDEPVDASWTVQEGR